MIKRRDFLYLAPTLCGIPGVTDAAQMEAGAEPISEPHFPSRLYQFVWRNWELANIERMASVVRGKPSDLLAIGASMGLPEKRKLTEDQLARIYITVIRQNWHLLPENQIIELLGWDRQKYEFTLKEDDFLDVKLGRKKPKCEPLLYAAPSAQEKARAAEIRNTVRRTFGKTLDERGEDLFAFIADLSDTGFRTLRAPGAKPAADEIDLTNGWSIAAGSAFSRQAARFQEYLRSSMNAVVAENAPKKIVLEVRPPEAAGRESFHIEVGDHQLAVTGASHAAVVEGLYLLQDQMESREGPFLKKGSIRRNIEWNPRSLYSYFALYGDPLMEPERDPFPDGYLEKLARAGINGVWMQAVLNTLAPSKRFPEFGEGWQTRLKNLNALVQRARRFGVGIFLYLNEPRAMPPAFFEKHPDIRGSSHQGLNAMCTSVPAVRDWLRESLAHVFANVPDLGGIFTITMSENHTNCFSHGGGWGTGTPNAGDCPRCSKRTGHETIAELLETFRQGVRSHNARADVIAYDWGWGYALAERLIPLLSEEVKVLSISEWEAPVDRGGVQTRVGEYSISVVGPGPRATRYWNLAKQNGNPTMAKLQFNNTWEISAVPFIPVTHLILEHCENLTRAGISGIMPSWTCGGYASPNLAAAKSYYYSPRPEQPEILRAVAVQRFGSSAADAIVKAWHQFSEAFREFPYGVHVYIIPTQHGPANPLRLTPTGYRPGMILFPYDDYKAWSAKYPPEVVQRQFARMASLWHAGLRLFEKAMPEVSPAKKRNAELDLAIARTCAHHFESTANQVEFYMLRDKSDPAALRRMRQLAEQEIDLARRQYPIARQHSVIAYEASNHYYYTPLDLVEKVLNCRHVISEIDRRNSA